MFKIGDKVSYASGDGIFEGEIIDIDNGALVLVSEGDPTPFFVPMDDATLVE